VNVIEGEAVTDIVHGYVWRDRSADERNVARSKADKRALQETRERQLHERSLSLDMFRSEGNGHPDGFRSKSRIEGPAALS
jgi:hypothetical protein